MWRGFQPKSLHDPCLQARFEAIEDKLKLVQENLKYFLEIMQHKKSDALEWTVRVLTKPACLCPAFTVSVQMGECVADLADVRTDYYIDCGRDICIIV